MEMLSHISFSVSDLSRSNAFYDAVLGAVGFSRVYSGETSSGWGDASGDEKVAIKKRVEAVVAPSAGFHLAFHAETQEQVHTFYEEGLKYGGRDNGKPGPRPEYGPKYYAAFLTDPDGYPIEVKLFVK